MTIANRLARRLLQLGATAALLLSAAAVQAQTVVYYHTDALGSVVATTDASRNVIEENEYEPYGKVINHALQDGPGYTGHVADAQTGMIYMQQRYYDDDLGEFPTVDPVSADSVGGIFNRYAYANNNPYRFVDPDGRVPRGSLDLCSNGCSIFDGGGGGAESIPKAPEPGSTPPPPYNPTWFSRNISEKNWFTGTGSLTDFDALAHDLRPVLDMPQLGGMKLAGGFMLAVKLGRGAQAFGGLTRAAEFGVQPYAKLRTALQGSGFQAHHLIEQRFAGLMGQNVRTPLSIRLLQMLGEQPFLTVLAPKMQRKRL